MKYITRIFDSSNRAAQAVAELIRELSIEKKQGNQVFNLAVSGGSTPKALFRLLAEENYKNQIPWEIVRFFWVDERCVEPVDSKSNFGMTYDALLQYAFIPASNIFRMKGEDIPENEAARYERLLQKELPVKNGYPIFDLILLGLGDDGHTASIFPNRLSLLESEKSVEVASHPVSGQKRITLTGNTINNADSVVFLVTGKNKASIIQEMLGQTERSQKYPASYVHNNAGEVVFYLDKEAFSYSIIE
jgi:6-phosphogluconolactonase